MAQRLASLRRSLTRAPWTRRAPRKVQTGRPIARRHRSASSNGPPTGRPTSYLSLPWHFLNFKPLPQGQGSLRPTLA